MNRTTLILALACSLLLSNAVWAQGQTEDPKWTGQVSAGWSSSRGNSHTDNLSASASAERRGEDNRISGGADYARSTQTNTTNGQKSTTEDWYRLLGQYDHFFSQKVFGFVNGRYESDKIAQLDYRLLLGAGAGYQLVESERTNVALEGGLAWKQEAYNNATPTSDDATLQLGYKVNHQIVDTVQLLHDLTYYPVIDDFSDYYVTSTGEFRGNFTDNMFSSFKVIYSRDATPAAGRKNSDIKYILGIGWNF